MPFKVRWRMFEKLVTTTQGRPENYGLPKPDHHFGEAHPTVSGRILDRISHGTVTPKKNIARLEGDRVHFEDGTSVHADVVIYCTGYKITFPFFDEDFISAPDNHIELFRRVYHPDIDNVFFVALLQPLGAIMPLAEAQGQWIADYLKGEYLLPPKQELLKDIHDDQQAMRKRYVAVQAPHDPGRLRRLPRGPAEGARGGRRARPQGGLRAAGAAAGRRRRGGRRVSAGPVLGRREATKQANRAAILDAARDVFADIGFGAASVRDIIRGTGLAAGTFYNYFPDKESVLAALLEESAVEARARVAAARARATTLREFVEGAYRAYFEYLAEDRATFEMLRRNAGTIREMFDEPAIGAGTEELATDLRAAIDAGLLPEMDTEYMAAAMVGAGVEVGVRMLDRDPPDVDGATAFVTELFLAGIARLPR